MLLVLVGLGSSAAAQEGPGVTTTTVSSPLLEEGPPVDPDAAVAQATTTSTAAPAGGNESDDTGRTVTLVVTGLVVLGLVFALITYWYWRRTRPELKPVARKAVAGTSKEGSS